MDSPRIKNEGWFYWLAFLTAIAFRFVELGAAALPDSEARLALQALHPGAVLAPQPAYILFTSIFFAVIKSTNFMARVVPALAGSVMIFTPYFFREKIKPRAALILAFLLAFDPGLTALSRQANGTILAVTFLLFAWGMWTNRRLTATGIFLGLALLSGPSIWSGLLTIGLTAIFLRGAKPRTTLDSDAPDSESAVSNTLYPIRSILISLVATLLLAGTLFLTIPNGLSAALSSIPAYFGGWVSPSTMTIGRTLLAFLTYELLGITLAVFSLIRGFRTNSKRILRLSLWLAVALILAAFYRQTNELVWAIIPLLALAAMELSRAVDIYREEYVEVGVVVLAIVILVTYIWFNISNIALNSAQISTTVPIFGVIENPRYFVLIGSMLILVVSIALVAFGWSARTARLGTIWSSVIVLGIYTVAAAWGASGMRSPGGVELWLPDSRPLQADLLSASVAELSDMSRISLASQPITIFGVSSPALEWVLRNYQVNVAATLDPQVAPPVVITSMMNELGLPSAYRGEGFTWRQTPQWNVGQNPDWLKWFVFRQLPTKDETIILWARDDLFPDAHKASP
jgi:hypothetical protein